MSILITIQDLTAIENLLQFSAQFIRWAKEPVTFLAPIGSSSDWVLSQVEDILEGALARFPLTTLHTKIRIGNPGKNILEEIDNGSYDLVILGDRPNHRVARAVRITKRALCPVIIVKGKINPIQHILMCDSGSAELPMLGSFTAQLINMLPGEQDVTILHVMSQISAGPGVKGEHLRANADELIKTATPEGDLLEQDLNYLEKAGLNPLPKVRHGLVVDEILAESRSGDYDLVIIGAHRQKWQQFLLADLARQITEKIDRPMMIVK